MSSRRPPVVGLVAGIACAFLGGTAQAGMVSYDLNDVVRLRLEDISFFLVFLLACGLGIQLLWNGVARQVTNIPRLGYKQSLGLTILLSSAMLLVLSMISGARELLTPEAWRRQGYGYKLNNPVNESERRRNIEYLRASLMEYARGHQGEFPPHDWVAEIPERIWQATPLGTHFVYVTGRTTNSVPTIIAYEPPDFGKERYVLFSDGKIEKLKADVIRPQIENRRK